MRTFFFASAPALIWFIHDKINYLSLIRFIFYFFYFCNGWVNEMIGYFYFCHGYRHNFPISCGMNGVRMAGSGRYGKHQQKYDVFSSTFLSRFLFSFTKTLNVDYNKRDYLLQKHERVEIYERNRKILINKLLWVQTNSFHRVGFIDTHQIILLLLWYVRVPFKWTTFHMKFQVPWTFSSVAYPKQFPDGT